MNLYSPPIIDFYVSVIDNYGDMGFAVNLALSLHEKHSDMTIRFFSDDENLFQKFFSEGIPYWLEYLPLKILTQGNPPHPAKLIYSLFDYSIPKEYLAGFSYKKTIIVFSYFLLHKGLESLHGTTYIREGGHDTVIHFIPSLLPGGGGIIINPEIERKKLELSRLSKMERREKFLESHRLENVCEKNWISVFVYPETLEKILSAILSDTSDTVFWICGDTGQIPETQNCRILPFLPIEEYGIFQSLCDANVVRGENSLCQSLISGKPTLWDIYKESNGAHIEKIEDYLLFLKQQLVETDWEEYVRIMRRFNGGERKELIFLAFVDFVSWHENYKGAFGEISEYVKKESDLVEKLEEILKK